MSDRLDYKQRDVVLARFHYRHEAEFAAGFLEEAGIPYRLQIDDPAIGLSIGQDATIWVRGIDERRARDVLEHSAPDPNDPVAWDGES